MLELQDEQLPEMRYEGRERERDTSAAILNKNIHFIINSKILVLEKLQKYVE